MPHTISGSQQGHLVTHDTVLIFFVDFYLRVLSMFSFSFYLQHIFFDQFSSEDHDCLLCAACESSTRSATVSKGIWPHIMSCSFVRQVRAQRRQQRRVTTCYTLLILLREHRRFHAMQWCGGVQRTCCVYMYSVISSTREGTVC